MLKIEKPWKNGELRVASEGRWLQNGQRPFFWLGDTAWLMLKRLDKGQIDDYLENRRQNKYNVIQVMLVHKLPLENHAGRQPFVDSSFAHPDLQGDSYWSLVDYALDKAEEKGLYLALVPAWGENVDKGLLNLDNVKAYTSFIAERYKNRPNIIWLVGGDTLGNANEQLWDIMGSTLRQLCPNQLITFHPFGATSSSQWFHNRDWLDFNMFQSGHSTYAQVAYRREDFSKTGRKLHGEDNWRFVEEDLAKSPPKPTIDGEPCYEQVLKGLHGPGHDFWAAADIRRFAYWAVFSGAMGHTYGHSAIMQFHPGGYVGAYKATESWTQAIHHPAAMQMSHLRRLMEDMDFTKGRPCNDWVKSEKGSLQNIIICFGCDNWALVHTATGRELDIKPRFTDCKQITAHWFDPVHGIYSYISSYLPDQLPKFTPPSRFDGSEDWVLVLQSVL